MDIESVCHCLGIADGTTSFRCLCLVFVGIKGAAVNVNSHLCDAIATFGCVCVNLTRRCVVGSFACLHVVRRKVVRSDETRWMVHPGLGNTEGDFSSVLSQNCDRISSKLLGARHRHKRGIGNAVISPSWRIARAEF
jgi:hypothetical protein